MPSIIIQSGVVMLLKSDMPLISKSGIYCLTPKKYSGKATKTPNVVGFKIADLSVIYFLSLVRQKTPIVKTRRFIDNTKIEE